MGMARYVVDAVLLEGRGAREVVAAHGISKSWIYELIKRFRAERLWGARGALALALRRRGSAELAVAELEHPTRW
jgi:transposase